MHLKGFVLGAVTSAVVFGSMVSFTRPATPVTSNQLQVAVDSGPPVKRSVMASDQCQPKGTQYYRMTKYFKAYDTMDACLMDGGRLPGRGKARFR